MWPFQWPGGDYASYTLAHKVILELNWQVLSYVKLILPTVAWLQVQAKFIKERGRVTI